MCVYAVAIFHYGLDKGVFAGGMMRTKNVDEQVGITQCLVEFTLPLIERNSFQK